ncbi:hypothetical protein MYAM1_000428 [Malassezia yamatoensis]|uniref:Uncharacterized protein n=1 Tax=Malassezia yamatoensis TaxID=253288 RepID=A0AAJ6CFG1_9BASI|nr:hypothetical protein MYAM1_000428 [Malassezia yamatoensis]
MDSPVESNPAEQTFVSYAGTPNLNTPYITQLAHVGSGSQRSQQNSPTQARLSIVTTENDAELASPTLSEAASPSEAAQRGNLSRHKAIHRSRASPALSDSSAAQRSSRMQPVGSSSVLASPSTSSIVLSDNESSGTNSPNRMAQSMRSPPLPRRFSPANLSTGVGIGTQDAGRTVQGSSTPTTSPLAPSNGTGEEARLSSSQSLQSDTSTSTNPVNDRAEYPNFQAKTLPWQPLKSQPSRASTLNPMASPEPSYGSDSSSIPVRSLDQASLGSPRIDSQTQTDPKSLQKAFESPHHSPSQRSYAGKSPNLPNSAPYPSESRIGTHEQLRSPVQSPNTSPLQSKIKEMRSSAANLPSSSSFQHTDPALHRSSKNGSSSETSGAFKGLSQIPHSRSDYMMHWRNGDPNPQLTNRPLHSIDGRTSTYRSPASKIRDMSPSRRISAGKMSSSNPSTPRLMSSSQASGAETPYTESGQRPASSLSVRTQEANVLKHASPNVDSPSTSRRSNFAIYNSASTPSGSNMTPVQPQSSSLMQPTSPNLASASTEGGQEKPLQLANVSQSRETPPKRGTNQFASPVLLPSDATSRPFASPAHNEKQSPMPSRPSETVSMSSRPVPAPPIPPRPGVAAESNSNLPDAKLNTPKRPTNRHEQTPSPSQQSLNQSSPTLSEPRLRKKAPIDASPFTKASPSTVASNQQTESGSPGSVYSLYAQDEKPLSESAPRSTQSTSPLPQHSPFKPGASPSVLDYTPSPNKPSNGVQQPLTPLEVDSATLTPQLRSTQPFSDTSQAVEQGSTTPSSAYSTPYIVSGTPSLPSETPKLSDTPALSSAGTPSLPSSTLYLPNSSSSSGRQHVPSPVSKSRALQNTRQDHQTSRVEETPFIGGTPSIANDTPYLGPEDTAADNSYSALGLRFPSNTSPPLLHKKVSHASIASSRSSYSDSNESDPVPHAAPAVPRESQMHSSVPEHSTPTTVQAGDMQGANATTWGEIPGSRVPSTSSEAITSPLQGLSDTFATAMADLGLDDSAPPPIQGLESVAVAYQTSPNTERGDNAQGSTRLESLLPPRTEASPSSEYGYAKLAPRADTNTHVPSVAPNSKSVKLAPRLNDSPKEPIPTMPPAPKLEVYGMTIWWPTSFDATSNANWDSTSTMQRCHLQARAANDLMDRDTNLTRWMMQLRQVQPRVPEAQLERVTNAQRQKHETMFLAMLDAGISNKSQSTLAADTSGIQLPTNIPYPLLARASKEHPQPTEYMSPQLSHSQSSASLHAPHSSRLDPGAAMRGAAGAAGAGWQRLQGAMPRVPSSTSFVMGTLGRRNSRRLRDPPSQPPQSAMAAHSSLNAPTSVPQRRPLHRASYYELGTPRSAPLHEAGQNLGQKSVRSASRQTEASNEPRFGLGIPGVGSRMGEDLRSVTPALLAGSLNLPPSVSKPNLAFENNLKRVMDAIPELDEMTARRYLQQAQGDDVRAVSDYMQTQGDPSRRNLFSRTPRTR